MSCSGDALSCESYRARRHAPSHRKARLQRDLIRHVGRRSGARTYLSIFARSDEHRDEARLCMARSTGPRLQVAWRVTTYAAANASARPTIFGRRRRGIVQQRASIRLCRLTLWKKSFRPSPSKRPVRRQHRLKPACGSAGAWVVAPELLDQVLGPADDTVATLDVGLGREASTTLAGPLESTGGRLCSSLPWGHLLSKSC
jgi:hypothetical protein